MQLSGSAQQAIGSLANWGGRPKWVEKAVTVTLPILATLVLLLFIGYQAAIITWQAIGEPENSADQQQVQRQPVAQTARQQPVRYGVEIANMHLFGVEGRRPAQKRLEKAPETRLKLVLHGVFVGEEPDKGSAIIGQANGKQRFYKVGMTISGGVILHEVYTDHVVIMRNKQREVLRFPKKSNEGFSIANRQPVADTGRESLKTYRDTFVKQPLKIFAHLRFVPVRGQGGVKGYRILPQGDRALFNKLGVKSSDLVTAINGTPLTDERKALQLLSELKNSDQLVLDIVRKGVPSTLALNLN